MTITLTGDVAFKTKLLNVLTANELGGTSAAQRQPACAIRCRRGFP